MAIELGTAFINVVPSAKGIAGNIARELLPMEQEASAVGGRAGSRFSRAFSGGIGNFKKFLPAAAFAGFGALAIHAAHQVEDANHIIVRTTGASGKAAKGLEESFKNVGRKVGTPLTQVATTVAQLAQRTGLAGAPLEDLTTKLLRFDKVSGQNLGVQELTRLMAGFNVPAKEMGAQLDRLFIAGQKTGVPITQLVGVLGIAGPTLRQFGFDLGQSAVLLGTLDKAGVPARLAIVGLRTAFSQFAREGLEPKKALHDVLAEITKLGKAGDEAGARKLGVKIFGSRGSGLVDAALQGKLNLDQLSKSLKLTGAGIDETASKTSTFGDKMKILKNQSTLALAEIAGPALDTANRLLGDMLPTITKITDAFAGLPKPIQDIALAATAVAVSVGPIGSLSDHLISTGAGIANIAQGTIQVGIEAHKAGGKFVEGFASAAAAADKSTGVFGTLGGKVKALFSGLGGGVGAAIDSIRKIAPVTDAVTGSLSAEAAAAQVGAAANAEYAVSADGAAVSLGAEAAAAQVAAVSTAELEAASGGSSVALIAQTAATAGAALATEVFATALAAVDVLASPWLLIAAAIVAVAAAIVFAYIKFKPFRDLVDSIGRSIKTGLLAAFNWIKQNWIDVVALILFPFIGLPFVIIHHLGAIVGAFQSMGSAIVGFFKKLGPEILDAVVSFVTAIPGALASLGPVLAAIGRGALEALKQAIEFGIAAVIISLIGIPLLIVTKLLPLAASFVVVAAGWMKSLALGLVSAIPTVLAFFVSLPGRIAHAIVGLENVMGAAALRMMVAFYTNEVRGFIIIGRFLASLPGRIRAAVGDARQWLVDVGTAAMQGLARAMVTAFVAVASFVRSLPGRIRAGGGNAQTWLVNVGRDAIGGLLHGITTAARAVIAFFARLPGQIGRAAANIGQDMEHIGEEIVHGVITGMKKAGTETFSTLKDIVVGAIDKVKSFLGINSPAKYPIPIGEAIPEGIGVGIKNKGPELAKILNEVVTGAINSANKTVVENPIKFPTIKPPSVPLVPNRADFGLPQGLDANLSQTELATLRTNLRQAAQTTVVAGMSAAANAARNSILHQAREQAGEKFPTAQVTTLQQDIDSRLVNGIKARALSFAQLVAGSVNPKDQPAALQFQQNIGFSKKTAPALRPLTQKLLNNPQSDDEVFRLKNLRQEIPRLSAAYRGLDTATRDSATFQGALSTASKIVRQELGVEDPNAVKIYAAALVQLTARQQGAADAARGSHTATLDLKDANAQLQDALGKTHFNLNENTQDGRDNARLMQTAADAANALAQAQIAAGTPIAAVSKTITDQANALFVQGRAAGESETQAAQLAGTLLGLPPTVVSTITTNAALQAVLVQGLTDKVNAVPDKKVNIHTHLFAPDGHEMTPAEIAASKFFPKGFGSPAVKPHVDNSITVNGQPVLLNNVGSAIFPTAARTPKLTPSVTQTSIGGKTVPVTGSASALDAFLAPPGKGPVIVPKVTHVDAGERHVLSTAGAAISSIIGKSAAGSPPKFVPGISDASVNGVRHSLDGAGAAAAAIIQAGANAHPVIVPMSVDRTHIVGGSMHTLVDTGPTISRIIRQGLVRNPISIVPTVADVETVGASVHSLPDTGAAIAKVIQFGLNTSPVVVNALVTVPGTQAFGRLSAAVKALATDQRTLAASTRSAALDENAVTAARSRSTRAAVALKSATTKLFADASLRSANVKLDEHQVAVARDAATAATKALAGAETKLNAERSFSRSLASRIAKDNVAAAAAKTTMGNVLKTAQGEATANPIVIKMRFEIGKLGSLDLATFGQRSTTLVTAAEKSLHDYNAAVRRLTADTAKLAAITARVRPDPAVVNAKKALDAAKAAEDAAKAKLFTDAAHHASAAVIKADNERVAASQHRVATATKALTDAESASNVGLAQTRLTAARAVEAAAKARLASDRAHHASAAVIQADNARVTASQHNVTVATHALTVALQKSNEWTDVVHANSRLVAAKAEEKAAQTKLFTDAANHASAAVIAADNARVVASHKSVTDATKVLDAAEAKLNKDRAAATTTTAQIAQDQAAVAAARSAEQQATDALRAQVDRHDALVAQVGPAFTAWLESLKLPPQYFDDIANSAEQMASSVRSTFEGLTNVATGGFRDLISGRTMEHVTEWAAAIRQMEAMGLAPSLIGQFLQAGPASWREAQRIVAGGQPLVNQLNSTVGQIFSIEQQTVTGALTADPRIALPPWANNPNEWAAAGFPKGGAKQERQAAPITNNNFNVTGVMDARTAALIQEWQDWANATAGSTVG